MNAQQYQITHGAKLKELLNSQFGQDTIIALNSLKPNIESHNEVHLHVANREKIIGYELAIRNLAVLTFVPQVAKIVEPDYGVKEEKKDEPKPVFVPSFVTQPKPTQPQ